MSSMTKGPSNYMPLLQGFFSNIMQGVMFVFLNDFLSQKKGLMISYDNLIIAVFGLGYAVGESLKASLGCWPAAPISGTCLSSYC